MINQREHSDRRSKVVPVEIDRREQPAGRRATDQMNVALAVSSHLVAGAIANRGLRLLDVLNDGLSDFVVVYDARVFSLDGKLRESAKEVHIPKSRLVLAAVPGDRHEAPEKRHTRHRAKKKHPAFLLVDRFAIHGVMHLEGLSNPAVVIKEQLGEFFAVDRATVTNLYGDGRPIKVQVAIVRTGEMSLLSIDEESGHRAGSDV